MTPIPGDYPRASIDAMIIALVRGTLTDAGQLAYIKTNADAIYEKYQVLVDVDCQFDRTGQVGFHKDSRGTTIFVNLSFDNAEEMQGTDRYEDVLGDQGLVGALPQVVQDDIQQRRNSATNDDIQSPRLDPYARFSFSDPNNYHSTPVMGHRYTRADEVEKNGDVMYMRSYLFRFAPSDEQEANEWRKLVTQLGYSELVHEFKRRFELYGHDYNFHGFEAKSSVSEQDREKLKNDTQTRRKRALSVELNGEHGAVLAQKLEKERGQKRTFVRTWVRFVPR